MDNAAALTAFAGAVTQTVLGLKKLAAGVRLGAVFSKVKPVSEAREKAKQGCAAY